MSRNDLKIEDAPYLAKIGSAIIESTMDLNQGLNFHLNAGVDANCGTTKSFCLFLKKVNPKLNANLFAALRAGVINLIGPMGPSTLDIGRGLVMNSP